MRRLKIIAFAALLIAAWSSAAHADNLILEYIEAWSGPGPYTWAKGFDIRVACIPSAEAKGDSIARQFWNCHTDDPSRVRGLFMFKATWGDSSGTQLFADDPLDRRTVKQLTIDAAYMHRLNSVVDVGGAIQWVRLTDDAQAATATSVAYSASTQWRTAPALRVSFTPLGFMHFEGRARGLSRLIHLQYESAYYGGSSTALDYGNPVSRYSAKKEFQSRVAIALDIAPLLVAIHPN
jgi:hypothetical protein